VELRRLIVGVSLRRDALGAFDGAYSVSFVTENGCESFFVTPTVRSRRERTILLSTLRKSLRQIEQKGLAGFFAFEGDFSSDLGAGTVAGAEARRIIEREFATDQLDPAAAAREQFMIEGFASFPLEAIDIGILMNFRRAVTAVFRNDEHLRLLHLSFGGRPLGVARWDTFFFRLDPDL
jgi:hypothetical protein